MEMPLTDRQEEVIEFVGKFIGENNYPPTIEEIQEGVGLDNPGSVYSALSGLEKKEYIKRKKHENRNIRLTETGEKFLPDESGKEVNEE
jgi:SOS-response transcriptional repressor LexA